MAPHLSAAELDWITARLQMKTVMEMYEAFKAKRESRGIECMDITNFRKVLKGKTYRRGVVETRGRKKSLTKKHVVAMNKVRKTLAKKAKNKGNRAVRWSDLMKKARVPKVHRTTAKKAFEEHGIPVAWRRSREKPQRTVEHERERVATCKEWQKHKATYFAESIDMIIDNKKFDVPTSYRAREYMSKAAATGHLRTPSEGLLPEYTKPGAKKNR